MFMAYEGGIYIGYAIVIFTVLAFFMGIFGCNEQTSNNNEDPCEEDRAVNPNEAEEIDI